MAGIITLLYDCFSCDVRDGEHGIEYVTGKKKTFINKSVLFLIQPVDLPSLFIQPLLTDFAEKGKENISCNWKVNPCSARNQNNLLGTSCGLKLSETMTRCVLFRKNS